MKAAGVIEDEASYRACEAKLKQLMENKERSGDCNALCTDAELGGCGWCSSEKYFKSMVAGVVVVLIVVMANTQQM